MYFLSVKEGYVLPDPRWLLHESGDWTMPVVDLDKVPFLEAFLTHHFQSKRSDEGTCGEDT